MKRIMVSILTCCAAAAFAADGTWQGGNGAWSDGANWTGSVPGGGGVATFIGAGATITNDVGTVLLSGIDADLGAMASDDVQWTLNGGVFELRAPALLHTRLVVSDMTPKNHRFDLRGTVLRSTEDVTVTGNGRLFFGRANELTGRVVVSNGTLLAASDGGFGPAPASYRADAIILDNGSLGNTDANPILTNHVNRGIWLREGGGYTSVGNNNSAFCLAAPITGPGALNINLEASPTILGNPANSYEGGTRIGTVGIGHNRGFEATLRLGDDDVIPDAGGLSIGHVGSFHTGARGATLDLAGHTENVDTFNAGPKAVITSSVAGQGRLITGDTDSNSVLRGTVTGGATIEKRGAGTLTAIGANVERGTIDLRGGTLVAGGWNLTQGATVRFAGGGMTLEAPSGLHEFTGTSAVSALDLSIPLTHSGWKVMPEKGATTIPNNSQVVYRGRWYVPVGSGGFYSFGKAFDDGGYLRIDSDMVISNTAAGDRVSAPNWNISDGWHDIELRFGNGAGGSGPMHGFPNGLLFDSQNGDFAESTVVARAKVFSDDGGPNMRATGMPNELRGRLLLASNATITVNSEAGPFVLGGNVTTEPGVSPEPILTIDNGGAGIVFGSSGTAPAVLDAPVAVSGTIVLTNRVWLRRMPQGIYEIAPGADIALDGSALLGDTLTLTDWSVRVVQSDSVGVGGAVTANTGTTVWFDTAHYADGLLVDGSAKIFDNDVTLDGGTMRFTGSGDTTYTGAFDGTGTLRIDGPGTVRLTDTTSSLDGEIILTSGYLRPATEAALGGASLLRLQGGRLANPEGSDLTLNAIPITGGPGGFEVFGAGNTLEINSPITSAGLSKWGEGLFVVGGTDPNTGFSLHVRGGPAQLAKTGASAFAANDFYAYGVDTRVQLTGDNGNQIQRNLYLGAGATLDLNGHDEGVGTFVGLAGGGTIVNDGLQAVTLTVGEGNATGNLARISLSDGVGGLSVTKVGTGAFSAPVSSLAYLGATRVEGGTLSIGEYRPPSGGMSYWLDATDASKLLISGGAVSDWYDSADGGVNFKNPTAAQRPQYVADGINGKPAVYFPDSTRNRLYTDTSVTCQTVFVVCQMTHFNSLAGVWGRNGQDNGIRAESATLWRHTGSGANANDFTYNGEMYINGIAGNTYAVGEPQIITAITPNPMAWNTAIGDYWNNVSYTRYFDGYIGEVLVYDSVLDEPTRLEIENYLKVKWLTGGTGQTLNTPIDVSAGATFAIDGEALTLTSLAGAGTLALNNGTGVGVLDYAGFTGTVVGAGVLSLQGADGADVNIRPQQLDTVIRNDGAADVVLNVDATGNTVFIGSVQDGASALGITQDGSGTVCYMGMNSAYTGATCIEGGTAQVGAIAAMYVRFSPTMARPGGDYSNTGYQLSEFRLTLGGTELVWPDGTRATCPGRGAGAEGPEYAIDDDVATKFYVNNNNQVAASPLVIQTPEVVVFDGYCWYTANDANGRDVVVWTVEISNDGQVWTEIDARDYSQDLAAVTTARRTRVGLWGVAQPVEMDVFSDMSPTTIAAPGTFALSGTSETVGALSGSGTVTLQDGATFGINAFEDAAFAGGISGDGTVVKSGAAMQTLSGALTFSGTLIVKAGTLDLTGATLTGVTNIIIMAGAELTGTAAVNGDLTMTFETGGIYSGSLAVSGALTVNGTVTLAVPDGVGYPYTGTLFTYASADATTQSALVNAIRPPIPSNMGVTIRVTGTEAKLTIAPTGTLLMLK